MKHIRSLVAVSSLVLFAGGCFDEQINPHITSGSSAANGFGGTGSGAAGGNGSGGVGGDGGAGGAPTTPLLGGAACDPLVPTQCGFPFPSNVYLVDDASTHSHKRVAFAETTLPVHGKTMAPIPASLVADSDGFSPGQAPITHLPGATILGLPTQHDIDTSLSSESPTILLDADTGELVPHFAELDMTATSDDDRTFIIRPVVRLKDAHRYIVAIRHVVDASGVELEPSPVFAALRDGTENAEPSVGLRRDLYADIFDKLDAAGIDKADLQLAWDYSTASRENNTEKMVFMRDDALADVGSHGPHYVIDTITDDPNPEIARRIEGHMTVPLYLDSPDPGGSLVLGANGMPEKQGTADYPFIVQIPHSATTGTPGGIVQNGHGLLGSRHEGENGYLATLANRGNFVTIAVDMIGMAEDDEVTAISAILNDPLTFRPFVDRQLQGMTNQLLAMRMMMGDFANDEAVKFNGVSAIDTTQHFYRGDSQGGIFGGTYMALSTDVARGLLGEPGAPYNLLLNRSVDFQSFFDLLAARYTSHRDLQLVLGVLQMLWDRVEPDGYLPYMTAGNLPNTPPHRVLIHSAIGDHQVTPLGAYFVARTVGAVALTPAPRPIWGIEEVSGAASGSAIVEYDYGALVPPLPDTNAPTTAPDDTDPHDWVREEPSAMDQSAHFFTTGEIIPFCVGTCDPN